MQPTVQEPLRDRVGRAIFEEPMRPGRGLPDSWYDLPEEKREPWRQDADRAIAVAVADLVELVDRLDNYVASLTNLKGLPDSVHVAALRGGLPSVARDLRAAIRNTNAA